jgi:creatinine amidohydrolase
VTEPIRLEYLTWREVEGYLRTDRRLAIVLGATEQHGHLAIGNDTLNAVALAERVSSNEGVILAPPLHYGISTLMAAFPGTLTLRVQTFASVVCDLVRSAYRSGFRSVLAVNGNGPHYMMLPYFTELLDELPGLTCDWFEWFSEPEIIKLLESIRPRGETHANWGENFPVSRPPAYAPSEQEPWWEYSRNVFLHSPAMVRECAPSGSFGGHQEVADADMERVFELAVSLGTARLEALPR